MSKSGDKIILGNAGFHAIIGWQSFHSKKNQKIFNEIGAGCMGHSLPSSIGSSIAINNSKVICVTGDGGIQVNIQELQTIKTYNLPIKIFIMVNGGYMSLVNTQKNYFDGRTDILVFSILSIITKNLYDFFYYKEYNKLNSFEFLISLNLLVWIKSECLLYVVSIYLAIIFFFKGNQKTKFFFSFYFLLIILTRFFFIIYYNLPFNPNVETFDTNIIPVSNIYDILYRSSLIFFWYLANLLKNPLMIINFLCFYFLIFNIKVKIKEFYFLIFIFFINSIAIYLTFLFTKYSFPFHLIGSLDRIIYQTSSLFLIPTFYLINKYFKKI